MIKAKKKKDFRKKNKKKSQNSLAWGGETFFAITLFSLIIFSPYRMERLISFLDPWQDCNNIGYQLCQALIGFGRGDWAGVGLG